MDEGHFLAPFLQTRLPALGLDAETYGSYVIGLVAASPEDEQDAVRGDEEEWNEILELLRASSESHGDDELVWNELKKDILQKLMDHQEAERQRLAEEAEQRKQALKTPILTIPDQDATTTNGSSNKPKNTAVDEETKKILLARYAYEEDGEEEGNDNAAGGDAEDGGANSNRKNAKQADLDRARELRNAKTTTKKEEQQKTKQARMDKAAKLEERRKRAGKGERKR